MLCDSFLIFFCWTKCIGCSLFEIWLTFCQLDSFQINLKSRLNRCLAHFEGRTWAPLYILETAGVLHVKIKSTCSNDCFSACQHGSPDMKLYGNYAVTCRMKWQKTKMFFSKSVFSKRTVWKGLIIFLLEMFKERDKH